MLTSEILNRSIKGMRTELQVLRSRLKIHSQHNKKKQMERYYAVGADLAKKIIKLEKIISEMYLLKLETELSELKKAA